MKRLELADFEPLVGSSFDISREADGSLQGSVMILTSAKAYDLDPKDRRVTDTSGKFRKVPFSIFFEDKNSDYFMQGMFTVKHPSFNEALEIFLVPLGPNDTGTGYLYEAAFG